MFNTLHVWQCGPFRFEQKRPLVVGILNVTPDSFSDGGKYAETFDALYHANVMLEAGADIIDVGGESTRPGSKEVAPDDEILRVLPVVKALSGEGICVSIDSRHPEVVRECLNAGAAIINDITGFSDPAMRELAQTSDAGCIVMHMQGKPQTMQDNPHYDDVVKEVSEFLLDRANLLINDGVHHDRICLDPGPGFGKNYQHNLALLQNTATLAHLGEPPFLLMSAWSRKKFIGEITGETVAAKRVAGSVAATLYAASQGAGVLRVHDVEQTVKALEVLDALNG